MCTPIYIYIYTYIYIYIYTYIYIYIYIHMVILDTAKSAQNKRGRIRQVALDKKCHLNNAV